MSRFALLFAAAVLACAPELAAASESGGGHDDPVAPVVLGLALILVVGKLGAELAVRLGHAAVLGELAAGILLGNLHHLGVGGLQQFATHEGIDILARLGVLVLLFQVGLESTVGEMLRVGVTSLLVAVIGVALPFAAGYWAAAFIAPESGFYAHVFVGATLTATSVGITARVFKDLGRSQTDEARVVLGAAVIDDVLGLVVLAVVVGIIAAAAEGRSLAASDVALTIAKSAGFLIVSLAAGVKLAPRALHFASRLRAEGVLLTAALAFTFLLAWASNAMGLAPIVGAFAAGLVLEDVHYQEFKSRGEQGLEHLLEPIASFLVPVFFVVMGMRTDLAAFANQNAILLALALLVVGVVGKMASGLGAFGKPVDKLTVGLGMIPRGEVGLIFAGIGKELVLDGRPVIDDSTFSALVMVIVVTTVVTPPLLGARLRRLAPGP